MSTRIRFHHSILGRVTLVVIVPFAVIVAVVMTMNARRTFHNLRQASEDHLEAQVALAAERIEAANQAALLSAQRMAEAQVAGMFGNRTASLAYARMVLENSPQFTAAYFVYEPGADGQDAASLGQLPAEAMDDAGRFIPYWFLSPTKGDRVELEPCVDMDNSLYYQGVQEAFARTGQAVAMLTEPYVYQGKMIVEQTYPLIIDGQFKGVAGVDRALTDVGSKLNRLARQLDVEAFLVSSRGKFIAATTDQATDQDVTGDGGQLKTLAIRDTPYRDLFGPLYERRSEHGFVVEDDPLGGQRCYFANAPIDAGGWLLILRREEGAVLAPIVSEITRSVVVGVIGVGAILALMTVSILRVSRRVGVAVEAANSVANGDLTRPVDSNGSHDETGLLLRSIAAMTGNLNGLIGHVKKASIQLNSTATQLGASSHELDASVSSFGASSNQIAAAVKEISATSTELAQTMDEINGVAGGTAELAVSGQGRLADMGSTMKSLAQATDSISEKLAAINDKATNISGVVITITKVADQTNLLSVNAAIEAEKAGEYGVGFLVVAREIRRLADQTAAATLDIENMVKQMQSAVSTGVMEMDRFADRVRHSVQDVATISEQMEQIIGQVQNNSERFDHVVDSVQSQSQGTEQISEAMTQLTSVAQRSQETNREFADAASDLQNAIGALQSAIGSFRLKS